MADEIRRYHSFEDTISCFLHRAPSAMVHSTMSGLQDIFQACRGWNIALFQHITENDFVINLLGKGVDDIIDSTSTSSGDDDDASESRRRRRRALSKSQQRSTGEWLDADAETVASTEMLSANLQHGRNEAISPSFAEKKFVV